MQLLRVSWRFPPTPLARVETPVVSTCFCNFLHVAYAQFDDHVQPFTLRPPALMQRTEPSPAGGLLLCTS